eukprot:CAMPEP_0172532210 /NCGR_PEP_ID=MMETSP1067-20121228/5345_1 /TAXON_ID=265564 ORGANISM="Thalassiosira punctigera, Strain Tpunct2005C2" /NCGR_SAMPLE_ID=MMETSP1067 /ASSEMBLY_ACC=CAM_ASM_000444 /LENGTH=338 /DNA_ID=CAMNT_0013316695 /DNA_START=191 /DNA_END=1207 /DNA_ORIENTATION=-
MDDIQPPPPLEDSPIVPCAITSDVEERYTFKSVIGEGAFGVVRKVQDKRTNDYYACKTITKNSSQYPSHLLQREVSSLRQVQPHPHLIGLHEVYESKTHVHIITELAIGGELYSRVATGKWGISESETAVLMKNIVEAIAHCHDRGVVHRDLKASNFLFLHSKSNTSVKVIDFGLARRTRALNDDEAECDDVAWILKSQVGTPYYIAPEVLTSDSYTSLCDVWSIGVIAYAILSRGRLPYCAENEAETIKMLKDPDIHVEFPDEIWKHYTPLAKEFCKALLQKDPTLRPTAKQVLELKWIHHHTYPLLGNFWGSFSNQFWSLFESESSVSAGEEKSDS